MPATLDKSLQNNHMDESGCPLARARWLELSYVALFPYVVPMLSYMFCVYIILVARSAENPTPKFVSANQSELPANTLIWRS